MCPRTDLMTRVATCLLLWMLALGLALPQAVEAGQRATPDPQLTVRPDSTGPPVTFDGPRPRCLRR